MRKGYYLLVAVVVLLLCVYLANEDMASGTIYRNTVWFFRGLSEYTRNGFAKAARSFNPSDLNDDVSNRSVMITGANSGIGKATAIALAKKGATVHMVCRNQSLGEEAKQEVITESGNDKIQLHILDISKPGDIVQFSNRYMESGQSLDVLVNNAGCMVNQRELTDDGLEKNFATNTLGTYLLTTGLIPVLEKSESPRVITVSSGGMLVTKLDPNDLQFEHLRKFEGTFVYAQNKRQQVVMTRQWAEKYPNIYFSSMHPGWADTPAVQQSMPSFHQRMSGRLRTPEEGADTIVWLCIAKSVIETPSGGFFQDRAPAPEHLPLAWTRSSQDDETLLMTHLEEIAAQFRTPSPPEEENTASAE